MKEDVKLGKNTRIPQPELVNLYGCTVGDDTKIGSFVEIQKNARIGARCKISSHTFICEGVTIEDEVFIGHNVTFINDKYPQATKNGKLQNDDDWKVIPTSVGKGSSVGSSVTVMCGIKIGNNTIIGAGALVTKDVPDYSIVVGSPARVVGDVRKKGVK